MPKQYIVTYPEGSVYVAEEQRTIPHSEVAHRLTASLLQGVSICIPVGWTVQIVEYKPAPNLHPRELTEEEFQALLKRSNEEVLRKAASPEPTSSEPRYNQAGFPLDF
jgi:hypothetical protein